MGSVSSLGSVDRSASKDNEAVRGGGFFERLNPWHAPRSKVDEFHRKNQEFLSKQQPMGQFSPSSSSRQPPRRVSLTSLDRPPPSMGTHRRLNSIENDDWTEPEEEDEQHGGNIHHNAASAVPPPPPPEHVVTTTRSVHEKPRAKKASSSSSNSSLQRHHHHHHHPPPPMDGRHFDGRCVQFSFLLCGTRYAHDNRLFL
jgi:hypothetical protein